MINNLSILFSLVVVMYVIVRASMLDARRPWFERADEQPTQPTEQTRRAKPAPRFRRSR